MGILILGDLSRAFPPAKDYWVIDGSIAGQNMLLAAEALGLGTVWLGTWPQMERVEAQRKLFQLPDTAVPLAILAIGYPDRDAKEEMPGPPPKEAGAAGKMPPPPKAMEKGAYEPDRVHFEKW